MNPLDADTAWMVDGECQRWPKLGWVKDAPDVGLGEQATMAAICDRCLVYTACERFVRDGHVTGGFWAGQHRWPSRRDGEAEEPGWGDAA